MSGTFDTIIDRKNTGSGKWDHCDKLFGGENLLPLWVADMDFRTPQAVIDAVCRRAEHGIFGYSTYTDSTYEAVINWFSRKHGWDIEKEWILYSPGVVPALNLIVQTFTEPGDGIIIQRPVYYPFTKVIENNGRKILNNPLLLDKTGAYEIDFENLRKQAEAPSASMMIFCSPHNPVGRVWREDELREIIKICSDNNILLISDDIHCDLIFNGFKHIPLHTIAGDFRNNIITCTAPSKTFNLAGVQVSNTIIPDKAKRNKFKKSLQNAGILDPNSFAPVVLEAAYNHGDKWLGDMLNYVHRIYELLNTFVKDGLICAEISELQGTYLAWVDFRKYEIKTEQLDDLFVKKAGVAPSPGHIFGPEGSGFMRFNLACPRSVLAEGLEKIGAAFKGL